MQTEETLSLAFVDEEVTCIPDCMQPTEELEQGLQQHLHKMFLSAFQGFELYYFCLFFHSDSISYFPVVSYKFSMKKIK